MADPAMEAWLEAFYDEHKYNPWDDPELIAKGLSGEEAFNEHRKAKAWGEEFNAGFGRPPTKDEYRHSQPRRYVNGELVSGFGGYPPEEIEKMRAGRGSGGQSGGSNSNGARGVRFRYVAPAPQRRNN